MNVLRKFWMVYNISGQGIPNKQLATLEEAKAEAHRLARHHMGNGIVVLEVVDAYCAIPPEAEQITVICGNEQVDA